MRSREIFSLVVRIAGLVSLLYFLESGALFMFDVAWIFIVRGILWIALSLWLLRGAPQLVRFAYPGESDK